MGNTGKEKESFANLVLNFPVFPVLPVVSFIM